MTAREIRGLRRELSLTQKEFAEKIGVAFATVNRWENGRNKPSALAEEKLVRLRGWRVYAKST